MLESSSKLPSGRKSLHRIEGRKTIPACFCLRLQPKSKNILMTSGKDTFWSATEKQVNLPRHLDWYMSSGVNTNDLPVAESRSICK